MRDDIERELQKAIALRRAVLQAVPHKQRVVLLEGLLRDFLVDQRQTLLRWAALTG